MRRKHTGDTLYLVLAKGTERYIWAYRDTRRSRGQTLLSIMRMVVDPDLSLSMSDAWALAKQMKATVTI